MELEVRTSQQAEPQELHQEVFTKTPISNQPKRNTDENMSPGKGHARSTGVGWGESGGGKRRSGADIPLVGCLANDTENLFTGGIEKSSEEIRKVTGVTGRLRCLHESSGIRGTKVEDEERAGSRRGTARTTPHFLLDGTTPALFPCRRKFAASRITLRFPLALAGVASKRTESVSLMK